MNDKLYAVTLQTVHCTALQWKWKWQLQCSVAFTKAPREHLYYIFAAAFAIVLFFCFFKWAKCSTQIFFNPSICQTKYFDTLLQLQSSVRPMATSSYMWFLFFTPYFPVVIYCDVLNGFIHLKCWRFNPPAINYYKSISQKIKPGKCFFFSFVHVCSSFN